MRPVQEPDAATMKSCSPRMRFDNCAYRWREGPPAGCSLAIGERQLSECMQDEIPLAEDRAPAGRESAIPPPPIPLPHAKRLAPKHHAPAW